MQRPPRKVALLPCRTWGTGAMNTLRLHTCAPDVIYDSEATANNAPTPGGKAVAQR